MIEFRIRNLVAHRPARDTVLHTFVFVSLWWSAAVRELNGRWEDVRRKWPWRDTRASEIETNTAARWKIRGKVEVIAGRRWFVRRDSDVKRSTGSEFVRVESSSLSSDRHPLRCPAYLSALLNAKRLQSCSYINRSNSFTASEWLTVIECKIVLL